MSTLEELLGIDPDDPKAMLGGSLVDANWDMRCELVNIRKDRGLTRSHVARVMGVSEDSVREFEHYSGNPELSLVARYAMAVGAYVTHQVWADPDHTRDAQVDRQRAAGECAARKLAALREQVEADLERHPERHPVRQGRQPMTGTGSKHGH